MSSLPGRSSSQKRRSFVVVTVALAVGVAAVAFALSRGGDEGPSGTSTPSSGTSVPPDQVTLQTACEEIAPDMALRVDALRRTAEAVRADIAAMQAQGNADDAEQATLVAVALENMADAQANQHGVRRATRELGQTLTSCVDRRQVRPPGEERQAIERGHADQQRPVADDERGVLEHAADHRAEQVRAESDRR